MPEELKVTIDGKRCTGHRGQTILEVAEENGIWIPTLCYDPRLAPYGACRLCLVEVEGARAFMPACHAEITPDMVVRLSLIHISEPTRLGMISYAVFCLKK